jgi:hypothetical protein
MTCEAVNLPLIKAWVRLHPDAFREAYPPRQVNNVYFDSHEMHCLEDNLIGVGERSKLRFRWYGTGYSAIRGFLELKHKSGQVGWKDQCPIETTLDLSTGTWPDLVRQLRAHASGTAAFWLAQADQPVLINGYMREYYESADRQVRVTIDCNHVAYEQMMYAAPNLVSRSHVRGPVIIEIKADTALHRRVSDVLCTFPLPTGRHSKYVSGLLGSLSFL